MLIIKSLFELGSVLMIGSFFFFRIELHLYCIVVLIPPPRDVLTQQAWKTILGFFVRVNLSVYVCVHVCSG